MPPPKRRKGLEDRGDLDPRRIVESLEKHRVEYVIVGGLAVIAHGGQRLTRDFDVLIDPTGDNCRKLIAALVELRAEFFRPGSRAGWMGLSPEADPSWIAAENRFFDTAAGGVDIWNRSEGLPGWEEARSRAIEVNAFGHRLLILDRDSLIRSKLAAGRDKDLADVTELGEI